MFALGDRQSASLLGNASIRQIRLLSPETTLRRAKTPPRCGASGFTGNLEKAVSQIDDCVKQTVAEDDKCQGTMATLKELFDSEFGHLLKCNHRAPFSPPTANSEVPQTLYCDFDGYICCLGCYVAEEFITMDLLLSVVQQHQAAISSLKESVRVSGATSPCIRLMDPL
jgi:hypothetical protein